LRPGNNIKTKRFEFTPETAVRNVLVAQVGQMEFFTGQQWCQSFYHYYC